MVEGRFDPESETLQAEGVPDHTEELSQHLFVQAK